MRFFLALAIFMTLNSAFATEIEVTSEDCNFEVRQDRDSIILRVNKIIAIADSISSWEIELPADKFNLPLRSTLTKKFTNYLGDETVVTYKNGILIHDHKARSNYTRDILELNISSDLKRIRSAKFSRRGTGILSLFGREKFECKF